jgi:hypothetical protein
MGLDIRPANTFNDDPAAACGTRRPHLSLLAQITDDGRLADEFRVAINSTHAIRVRFKGSDVFVHHKQFHCFTFTFSVNPHELSFPVGRLTTTWIDIHDGRGADFSEVWDKHAADISRPGGAIRWG